MERSCDVLVTGGGLGGVAAALAAARAGRTVILSEPTVWLGGQLTSQAVPPDEHPWIERFGATRSYRALREEIRAVYRRERPLTPQARADPELNPGAGFVSRLCHEPRAAVAAIDALLAPVADRMTVLRRHVPVRAETDGDAVRAVTLRDVRDGSETTVAAPYVLDATETGDLLPLAGVEYVTGFESRAETGEPQAPVTAQPLNMQAISVCFALEHRAGEDHVIDRPPDYAFWRDHVPAAWPGPLLSWTAPDPRTGEPVERVLAPNPDEDELPRPGARGGDADLWRFRRIRARRQFAPGAHASDVTLVNWPMIDYWEGPVVEVAAEEAARHVAAARGLSLAFLHWMQTEAPRPDGGTGFPGLRLRPDVTGTADGLAMAPYVREARRIRALRTVTALDFAVQARGDRGAVRHPDSVGVGAYRIDLHPSTGGDPYIDVAAHPFEVPLGALLPQRVTNLLAAGKAIGTTHVANGAYRLHPVEWGVGEAAGTLAAFCLERGAAPHAVRAGPALLEAFQRRLTEHGVELHWPAVHPL